MKSLRNYLLSAAVSCAALLCAPTTTGTSFSAEAAPQIQSDVTENHNYAGTKVSEIKTVSLENFNPPNSGKKLELRDKILEELVTKGTRTELLEGRYHGHDPDQTQVADYIKVRINDLEEFNRDIVEVILDLYDEDSWTRQTLNRTKISDLSIRDAVELSGKITIHQLMFHHQMARDTNRYLAGEIGPGDASLKIDTLSHDEIFKQGKGICRNYAGVNSAVFEALKEHNPNLQNTYMTSYYPDSHDEYWDINHAWNKVSTLVEEDGNVNVYVTYVDATWADEGKPFNALDEAHFGTDNIAEVAHRATVYELLADQSRMNRDDFPLSGYDTVHYLTLAAEAHRKITRILSQGIFGPFDDQEIVNEFGQQVRHAEKLEAAAQDILDNNPIARARWEMTADDRASSLPRHEVKYRYQE